MVTFGLLEPHPTGSDRAITWRLIRFRLRTGGAGDGGGCGHRPASLAPVRCSLTSVVRRRPKNRVRALTKCLPALQFDCTEVGRKARLSLPGSTTAGTTGLLPSSSPVRSAGERGGPAHLR